MLPRSRATIAVITAAAAVGLLFMGATSAGASVSTQLQTARDNLANCQLLASNSTSGGQRERALQCVTDQQRIITLLSRTTTTAPSTSAPTVSNQPTDLPPTATSQATPTSQSPTSPTTTPTLSVPTVSPSSPSDVCPPWPATPDANCTGFQHTGVTLRTCPTRITQPGVYDGCQFNGTLVIAADGVFVTRSFVNRGHVEGSPSMYNLRNAILQDVKVLGAGNDGVAAMGPNNYTCRRCEVTGGNRGFALGNNVLIEDSYAHNFYIQSSSERASNSVHQTAASTHGGSNVIVRHSTLRCASDRYACSSGVSFYSEDAPGISNYLLEYNNISTDAGYGLLFASNIPGKPYPITNTRILNNVLSSQEYGPTANFPASATGNQWSGNRSPGGGTINP